MKVRIEKSVDLVEGMVRMSLSKRISAGHYVSYKLERVVTSSQNDLIHTIDIPLEELQELAISLGKQLNEQLLKEDE